MYLFKFSQTGNSDGVKKNGIHFVDNDNAPYNIGGMTRGGAVLHLCARAFAGGHDLHAAPIDSGGADPLYLASSYHQDKDYYYLFSANEAGARNLYVDLSDWDIEPGTVVEVEEVSDDHLAEVTHLVTVPANRVVSLTQKAQSLLLLSVPRTVPDRQLLLSATDDAMVKAGSNSSTKYGSSPNLVVKNSVDTPGGRSVSFVKFDTSAIGGSLVERAVLQLSGENLGSDSHAIAHVYGLTNDDWDESTITWATAPNLASSEGVADSISDNFILGINDSAEFVGHLTADQNFQLLSVDVTDFLREHADQQVTFLIAREVRFNGENVSDALNYLNFASNERGGDLGPKLWLELRGPAVIGDYDGSGTVDPEDYLVWKSNFGSISNLAADGNHGGIVDAADYTIWRDNLNDGVASVFSGNKGAVPEPTGLQLLGCASAIVPLLPFRCSRVYAMATCLKELSDEP